MNKSALKVIAELYPKHGVDLWKHVQYRGKNKRKWWSCKTAGDLDIYAPDEYRIKPNTHIVNGIECPAPLSELPRVSKPGKVSGEKYWYIDLDSEEGVACSFWNNSLFDRRRFKFGIYATYEDALSNLKAHYLNLKL